MFVNSSSWLSGSGSVGDSSKPHRGLLISRPLSVAWSSQRPAKCLRLSYHLAGDDCSLTVNVLSADGSLRSAWTQNCAPSDATWHELELSLRDSRPFQVSQHTVFECSHLFFNHIACMQCVPVACCYRCSVVCVSVCLLVTTMTCAKTIKLPFDLCTWMGPKNRVLDGDLHPPEEGAIWGRDIVEYWL